MTSPRLPRAKADLVAAGREGARRAFFRSRVLRRALVLVLWPRLRRQTFDLAHLSFYLEEEAIGPVQRDEALLLHALTRVVRPRVIVEVGFLGGMSSLNFLLAMDPSAKLYAFDISAESERLARTHFRGRSAFSFQRKSQEEIIPADVDFQRVDLLFLDASHELALNIRTFERIHELMADDGIVVIHDTGTWHRDRVPSAYRETFRSHPYADNWIGDEEYQHQPEEREFVNWIRETHPEYAQLQLHTTRTLRHGMTLLQRGRPLATNPELSARLRAQLPARQG
ncbi:MAG TPA: class I SAM-dependent methyltransferase [Solirubrobacteraceae bacterium]|nr:class I SAM-dependent methyltransferase [Solirubrobacteraceae bacterium]